MDKKPIILISNDWHIKEDNCQQITDLVRQQIITARSYGCEYLACLGDVFNSRKHQSQQVLQTFKNILDEILSNNLKLIVIPGNHDKTVYEYKESFLDPFEYHPALHLIRDYNIVTIEGIEFQFIPFFIEEQWLQYFEDNVNFSKGNIQILCSHIAVTGSRNNDGKKVENVIKPSLFRKFHKVLLGHYHDHQKIGDNIYHLPSIQQNNFGENPNKGFTFVYNDGSIEIINSQFKPFKTVKIDLDTISKNELNALIAENSVFVDSTNIRFSFTGNESKLKSINKESIRSLGIDVKVINKDIEVVDDFDQITIVRYNNDSILEELNVFCEDNNLDFETAKNYFNGVGN